MAERNERSEKRSKFQREDDGMLNKLIAVNRVTKVVKGLTNFFTANAFNYDFIGIWNFKSDAFTFNNLNRMRIKHG